MYCILKILGFFETDNPPVGSKSDTCSISRELHTKKNFLRVVISNFCFDKVDIGPMHFLQRLDFMILNMKKMPAVSVSFATSKALPLIKS
jgi:hypothetical protein